MTKGQRTQTYLHSFFLIKRFNLENGCLQDTRSRVNSMSKQQNVLSRTKDFMAPSIEASNCSSCPLYRVKAVFCLLPRVVMGYKSILGVGMNQRSLWVQACVWDVRGTRLESGPLWVWALAWDIKGRNQNLCRSECESGHSEGVSLSQVLCRSGHTRASECQGSRPETQTFAGPPLSQGPLQE